MSDLEGRLAARSLRWLAGLIIPPENIEDQLQRCLGCWAAEILKGVSRGQPGDRPLRRLLNFKTFDISDYSGDPLLVLAIYAALRARGVEHESLASLVAVYARAVNSANADRVGDLSLVRALLQRAGLDAPAPAGGAVSEGDQRPLVLGDRDDLLNFCNAVSASSVWGDREVEIGDLTYFLPPLAVSYAMDSDLEVVCALLRTCAYLGLADQTPCRWAKEWLIDQHNSGRFGLILQECRLSGQDPKDSTLFFRPTVRALWTLAELRHPRFLLDSTTDPHRAGRHTGQHSAVGNPEVPAAAHGADAVPADARKRVPLRMQRRLIDGIRLERNGLRSGMAAPGFRLADLFGRGDVSLSDYRGQRVLLVFSDPDCRPCDELIAQLVAFDKQSPRGAPKILLVSRGDSDANRRKFSAHEVGFPVVLQDRWSLSRLYGIFTFPVAFLIDEEGVTTRNVAQGSEIAALLTSGIQH